MFDGLFTTSGRNHFAKVPDILMVAIRVVHVRVEDIRRRKNLNVRTREIEFGVHLRQLKRIDRRMRRILEWWLIEG